MGTCETCLHWVKVDAIDYNRRRLCVLHTGLRGTDVAKLSCKDGPVTTKPEFGCTEWKQRVVDV